MFFLFGFATWVFNIYTYIQLYIYIYMYTYIESNYGNTTCIGLYLSICSFFNVCFFFFVFFWVAIALRIGHITWFLVGSKIHDWKYNLVCWGDLKATVGLHIPPSRIVGWDRRYLSWLISPVVWCVFRWKMWDMTDPRQVLLYPFMSKVKCDH